MVVQKEKEMEQIVPAEKYSKYSTTLLAMASNYHHSRKSSRDAKDKDQVHHHHLR